MNGGTIGQGEGKLHQREAPAEMKAEKLETVVDIRAAIDVIGGHNLLDGHGESDRYQWLNDVQSTLGAEGAAIGIKEGDTFVGFMLCDHEGNISQLWSAPNKEADVVKKALKELPSKVAHQLSVRINSTSTDGERARGAFIVAGFSEREKTDTEIVMEKK